MGDLARLGRPPLPHIQGQRPVSQGRLALRANTVINDTAGTLLRSFTFTTYSDPNYWVMEMFFEKAVRVNKFHCGDFQLQSQRAAVPANYTRLQDSDVRVS